VWLVGVVLFGGAVVGATSACFFLWQAAVERNANASKTDVRVTLVMLGMDRWRWRG
jgi:hypothetical protein